MKKNDIFWTLAILALLAIFALECWDRVAFYHLKKSEWQCSDQAESGGCDIYQRGDLNSRKLWMTPEVTR